jgi:predicted enzyme related to lactoylglutathione lyase
MRLPLDRDKSVEEKGNFMPIASNWLSHVTVNVSDLERSKRFYQEAFGWDERFAMSFGGPEFEAAVGVPGAAGSVAGGVVGDFRIELVAMSFLTTPPTPGLGMSKLSFQVDDAQTALDALAGIGATVVAQPNEIAGCVIATVLDPDGQVIDLIQYLADTPAWGGDGGRAR